MKQTHINAFSNDDGSRNVSFYQGESRGWMPAGRLMPKIREVHNVQTAKAIAAREEAERS